MRKAAGAALFAVLILLFLIANRGAYQGYFEGDDLDNLAWTQQVQPLDMARDLIPPWYFANHFRPLGYLYFAVMGQIAGLRFPWYVALLHAFHLLNLWILWRLLKRFKVGTLAALAGTLFFAFHMAVFDAYWKPMYIFDVLCALFCLLSLLSYTHRKWILSFVCFWLAFKAKELAVMLPAVLALYEYWFGDKRWKRLIPFFAVSLFFGLQALLANPGVETDYALSFSPRSLLKTTSFYASELFLLPYLGFVVLALPFIVRDRRVHFGLACLGLLLLPMLGLPGRLYGAYLYAPLVGASIALAALAAGGKRHRTAALLALFFAVWIPFNYSQLRANRRATLTAANDNHTYVSTLAELPQTLPDARAFVYDGAPSAMYSWGVAGAVRYLYGRPDLAVYSADNANYQKAFQSESFALLNWDPVFRKLLILPHTSGMPDFPYFQIAANRLQPIWQLDRGWYPWEYSFRWIQPYASARLRRPRNAGQFELIAHIGPDQIRDLKRTTIRVLLDGQPVGRQEFTVAAIQTVRWNLPPGAPGPVRVEFRVAPEYRPTKDSRSMGIPIAAFGFKEN
jgi:hypothetical protein